MRFITSNQIAKRCPNGKRFDEETQTCIPREEWEAKHKRKPKKTETKEEQGSKNREVAEKVREMRTHYGIPETNRKELKKFYDSGVRRNPFKRSEDAIRYIDKAMDDESISLDKVLSVICDDQFDSSGDTYSEMFELKGEGRKALLTSVKTALEITPFVSNSISGMWLEPMGESSYGTFDTANGFISINKKLCTKGIEIAREDYATKKDVINPKGEKDTIAWSFSPEGFDEMSDEEKDRYNRIYTITHEMGHSIGFYMENIAMARRSYATAGKERHDDLNIKEIFNKNRGWIIESQVKRVRDDLKRYGKDVDGVSDDVIDDIVSQYESICQKYYTFDPSRKMRLQADAELSILERKANKLLDGKGFIYMMFPDARSFRDYDKSVDECTEQRNIIESCEKIYKELYGLDDDTFNPFDVYSEYGYYAQSDEAKTGKSSSVARGSDSQIEERVAEAFADVCARGDKANTMSVLIVSAINYTISKNLCGGDADFHDYFFGESMNEQRQHMKDNRIIKGTRYIIFNGIDKAEPCPSGTHRHSGINGCHPIDKPHKEGSGAQQAHDKWVATHGGNDGGDVQNPKPKDDPKDNGKENGKGRELKPCPSGQHRHSGIKGCHPISSKHREGSGAELAHNKWMQRHGDKEKDESKDDKPKEKEDDPKTEIDERGITELYAGGMGKPEYSQKIGGFVRQTIRETDPEYYDRMTKDADAIIKSIKDIDWSADGTANDVVKPIKDAFPTYATYFPDFDSFKIEKDDAKQIMESFATVIEEFPWALSSFNGFFIGDIAGAVGFFSSSYGYIKLDAGSAQDASKDTSYIETDLDPVTKKLTDWGFHFAGSTVGSCISHEFGHMMDYNIRAMRYIADHENDGIVNEQTYPFSDTITELANEYYGEDEDGLRSDLNIALDVDFDSYNVISEESGTILIGVDGITSYRYDEFLKRFKKKHGFKEVRLFGNKGDNSRKLTGLNNDMILRIQLSPKQVKEYNKNKPKPETQKATWKEITEKYTPEELAKKMRNVYPKCDEDSVQGDLAVDRIKECEELYKEIYGVDQIVPSEVYSRYGYYGTGTYKSGSKKILKETQATERVADAMRDVSIRGDKANSMSHLILAHMQYETYQVVSGDYDTSFKQFVKKNIGMDKFGEKIIKMRYLLFNRLEKAEPCPAGTHRHSGINGCHPISKPHKEGSGALEAHNKWIATHGGADGKEQGEKKKPDDEKVDGKEDEKGRKLKPCPEGQHRHSGIKGCHPISNKHKEGSGAELAHNKWMNRHGKKKDDEDDKKPSEDEKEEDHTDDDNGEIKPYTDGIDKPISIQYSKGVTERAIKDSNPKLMKGCRDDVKTLRSNFESIDWEKGTNSKIFDKIFGEYNKKYGKEIKLGKGLSKMPKDMFKSQMEVFIGTLEEYPMLVTRFNGFTAHSGDWLMYCEFGNTLAFNMKYYEKSDNINRDMEGVYKNIRDPITRDETTWGFHFKESTYTNCMCHELGHALDNTMFALSYYIQNKIESGLFDDVDQKDVQNKIVDVLNASNSDILHYGRKKTEITSDIEDRGDYLAIKIKGPMYTTTWANLKQAIKDSGLTMDDAFYGTGKRGQGEIHIKNPIKQKGEKKAKKFSELTDDDFAKIEKMTQYSANIGVASAEFSKTRIYECEELYKELYNVDKIVPSDVYSIYGYYGTRDSDRRALRGETTYINRQSADERMAEAMSDVMVRKDKANSMSQLIVCHTEYEMYRIATGDFDLSFRDYVKDKVGFDKFSERIIKMRYIPYAMVIQ